MLTPIYILDLLPDKSFSMVLALLIVVTHVVIDYFQIRGKKAIDHGVELSIFILVSLLGTLITQHPLFLILTVGVRYLLFDYLLNWMRRLPWNHHGVEDDEEDATTDKILSRFNPYLVLGTRVFSFIIATFLYYHF